MGNNETQVWKEGRHLYNLSLKFNVKIHFCEREKKRNNVKPSHDMRFSLAIIHLIIFYELKMNGLNYSCFHVLIVMLLGIFLVYGLPRGIFVNSNLVNLVTRVKNLDIELSKRGFSTKCCSKSHQTYLGIYRWCS